MADKEQKKPDLGLLEEDDEFEEFPAEGINTFFTTNTSDRIWFCGLVSVKFTRFINICVNKYRAGGLLGAALFSIIMRSYYCR